MHGFFLFLFTSLWVGGLWGLGHFWLRAERLRAIRRRPFLRELRSGVLTDRIAVGLGMVMGVTVFLASGMNATALASVLLIWPAGLALLHRLRTEVLVRSLERAGLVYLHALKGLLSAGVDLPAALVRLSQSQPSPFSRAMSRSLSRFAKGLSVEQCLSHFRGLLPDKLMACCLSGLWLSYREGGAVVPVLNQSLRHLEQHFLQKERVRTVHRGALVQGGIAFFIPWVLRAALVAFSSADLERPTLGGRVVLGVLLMEGVGLWLLARISRFG
jgi:type II secretory pathway component PulF